MDCENSKAQEPKVSYKKLNFVRKNPMQMLAKSEELYQNLTKRRTVRTFSSEPVPREVLENCLMAASSSPSGANKQPYKFVVVENQETKEKVRVAAEKEEHLFYSKRASVSWLKDLETFKTNSSKPYLSKAPYLVAIFAKPFDLVDGEKTNYYYPIESTGIAIGSLINCLHQSGLATLTHTPSPMNFLNKVLEQPPQYKAMILLIVGYPEEGTEVPEITRKPLNQIAQFI